MWVFLRLLGNAGFLLSNYLSHLTLTFRAKILNSVFRAE
eukprot:UN08755